MRSKGMLALMGWMRRIAENNAATAVLCALLASAALLLLRRYWHEPVNAAIWGVRTRLAQNGIFYRLSDYDTLSSAYGRVYYSEADRIFAESAAKTLDFYYPLLAADMNADDPPPCDIIIYPSFEAMRQSLCIDIKTYPMGLYYMDGIHILSPRIYFSGEEGEMASQFIKRGPLIHELTHYLMDKSVGNAKNPTWINEGVALYFEYKYLNFEWRPDLSEEAEKLPDECLMDFTGDEAVLYRRSYEVIAGYVERNGEKGLMSLLRES